MKTQQLKMMIGSLSVLSFGWIAYGFADFFMHHKEYLTEKTKNSVKTEHDNKFGKTNRNDGPRSNFSDYANLYDVNITLEKAPDPITKTDPVDPAPTTNTISNILKVGYIQLDPDVPEQSKAFVIYTDLQLKATATEEDAILKINGTLPGAYKHFYLSRMEIDALYFKNKKTEDEEQKVEMEDYNPAASFFASARGGGGLQDLIGQVNSRNQGYSPEYKTPEKTTEVRDGEFWIGREEADSYEQNYQTIFRDLQTSVARDSGGKPIGIKIGKLGKSTQGYAHGVEQGDIIKSINGTPVKSKAEAISYVKAHPDLPKYVVVIERKGADITKVYVPPPKK